MNKEDTIKAKNLAKELSSLVNEYSDAGVKLLLTEMANDHRTLQQGYTRFALGWLYQLSQTKEGDYDIRNQASVEIARKIDKAVDLRYARCLPVL